MTLYEVLWDNGMRYEDHFWSTKTYSSLEKAKEEYNRERFAQPYTHSIETLTLSSFDEDDERQVKTKIAARILPTASYEDEDFSSYEEEWEPDMEEYGECDPNALL